MMSIKLQEVSNCMQHQIYQRGMVEIYDTAVTANYLSEKE
jgi:hypothetical protein